VQMEPAQFGVLVVGMSLMVTLSAAGLVLGTRR
jgi:hypothetical protein